MMESTQTCCALTRLDPIISKVPTVGCTVGCPGAGNVVDWPYANPKKRDKMHSEETVPITERKKREERGGVLETRF